MKAATLTFIASLVGLFLMLRLSAPLGKPLMLAVLLALGVLTGMAVGVLQAPRRLWRVGAAAFTAACIVWSPVVLATYGFALVALPALMAYAVAAVCGIALARRLRA